MADTAVATSGIGMNSECQYLKGTFWRYGGRYFVTVRLNIQIKTRTIFKPLSYFSRTLGQRTYITEYLGFKFRFHSQKKKKKKEKQE